MTCHVYTDNGAVCGDGLRVSQSLDNKCSMATGSSLAQDKAFVLTALLLTGAVIGLRLADGRARTKWCAAGDTTTDPAAAPSRQSTHECSSSNDTPPTPRHMYLTYWSVALILIWVPLAVGLRLGPETPATRMILSGGSFAVATVAALVITVRLLIMGVPGHAPWTSNVMDMVTHLAVPVLALWMFLSNGTPAPSKRAAGIGGGIAALFGGAWFTAAMLYWRRTGQWVYKQAAPPSTPAGIVSSVMVACAAGGLATGLYFLKHRLPAMCPGLVAPTSKPAQQ